MPALVQQGFQLVTPGADHHLAPAAHVQPKELGLRAAGMLPADYESPLLKGGDGLLQLVAPGVGPQGLQDHHGKEGGAHPT